MKKELKTLRSFISQRDGRTKELLLEQEKIEGHAPEFRVSINREMVSISSYRFQAEREFDACKRVLLALAVLR